MIAPKRHACRAACRKLGCASIPRPPHLVVPQRWEVEAIPRPNRHPQRPRQLWVSKQVPRPAASAAAGVAAAAAAAAHPAAAATAAFFDAAIADPLLPASA